MSGICGIVNFDSAPVDQDVLHRMAEASAYRGPHGIRYWTCSEDVGFAHLALNTTPESLRGQQPLVSGDGMTCITADARVDNRGELVNALTAKGHLQEVDPTDVELILAAYKCWGEGCAERIIGDFAFAIWDMPERKLFCARDAAGARPFCYHTHGDSFRFGSDVRQILADGGMCRDLDGYAISDFLTSNFRYQARTMFAAVQKLLPGHCLVAQKGGIRAWRHWNPDRNPPIHYRSDAEYVEHFRDLLFRCVADRLRSLRGSAAILTSGGMDSTSVAAIAQRLYSRDDVSARPVAFTEVFDTLTECDEREYSLTLPVETGLELHQIDAEHFFLLDNEAAYTPALESPAMHYESLTRHLLAEAQGRGCDVVLSGHGGDSLFIAAKFGYFDDVRGGRWWRLRPWLAAGRQQGQSWASLIRSLVVWPLLPRRVRYAIDRRHGSYRYGHVPTWIDQWLRRKTRPAKRLYQQGYPRRFRSDMRQFQYERLIGLADQSVAVGLWNERATQFGMEARFPLLDRRLAEFVLAAPLGLGARPGKEGTKWLLRQAVVGVLPEKIRRRPDKRGWDKYMEHMMHHQARPKLRALFAHTEMARHQLVDDHVLLDEYDAYCKGGDQHGPGSAFVLPMCMELWLRVHVPCEASIRFDTLQSWQFE